MKIAVIDGQGGGLGTAIIARIRDVFGRSAEIIALGTNAIATSGMIKAGADRGATGENAIIVNCAKADIIMGPLAVILPDSLLGEITLPMARAVATSGAPKLLLPVSRCGVWIAGVPDVNMETLVDGAVAKIREIYRG